MAQEEYFKNDLFWFVSVLHISGIDSLVWPFTIGDRHFLGPKESHKNSLQSQVFGSFFTLTFHTNISNVINLYHFHSLVNTKDHSYLFNTRKYSHNHNRRKNPSLIFLKHRLTNSGVSHLFNCITVFRKLKVVLISTLEDKRLQRLILFYSLRIYYINYMIKTCQSDN